MGMAAPIGQEAKAGMAGLILKEIGKTDYHHPSTYPHPLMYGRPSKPEELRPSHT